MPQTRYSLDMSLQKLLGVEDIRGGDILEIRHLISGGSIIDWTGLHFRAQAEVDEFLRVSRYDPDNILDMERLSEIHQGAVTYIQTELGIEIPVALVRPSHLQRVFIHASERGEHRSTACMILKVMHVINHLEARELLYHLPVSEREFFARVERRVSRTVNTMLELGFPIETYQASQKTKESLITKLLSKRKDTAAQVFDRIRFRIIADNRNALIPILIYLKQHLTPFPYVIPGESANTIGPISNLFREALGVKLKDRDREYGAPVGSNPFSHREFRVISFVVDVPIRVDDLADPASRRLLTKFGHIVFVPTEFQIFDKASYFLNESGPAAHDLYKARQISEVIKRLFKGDEVRKEDYD
jgi:uncharacterized protein (TIGR04552 family)